jgi:vacuolar-type H+-ATPase catalytic subunit A/Vma1
MDSSSNGFANLRAAILQQVEPLLNNDQLSAEDRFTLSVQIAQTKGTLEAYQNAFHVAQQIQSEEKLSAMMDLLDSVDARIQESYDEAPSQSAAEHEQNQQPQGEEAQPGYMPQQPQ